jgi:hypothetical protein
MAVLALMQAAAAAGQVWREWRSSWLRLQEQQLAEAAAAADGLRLQAATAAGKAVQQQQQLVVQQM